MQTITTTENLHSDKDFQKLVQEASYVEVGETVVVSKGRLNVTITKQSPELVAEQELLISVCEETVEDRALWNNELNADEQIRDIARNLQLLGLSFAQMMKIGNEHSIDKSDSMIRNVITNYLLAVEDIFREALQEKINEDELDCFIDNISLGNYTHDCHYKVCHKHTIIDFAKLHSENVLSFYKLADEIDEDKEIYALNGITLIDGSGEEMNSLLLEHLKTKVQELIKKGRA